MLSNPPHAYVCDNNDYGKCQALSLSYQPTFKALFSLLPNRHDPIEQTVELWTMVVKAPMTQLMRDHIVNLMGRSLN